MSLTLPKLLLAALVIWLAWRFFSRLGAANRKQTDTRQSDTRPPENRATRNARAVEDMVKCPKCGSYVPAKGGHDCAVEAKRG